MREVLANTPELAQEALRAVRDAVEVTVDTETSGLDQINNHVVGYVLTPLGGRSYYVPLRHLGGGNLPGVSIPATPTAWRGDLHPFELELAEIANSRHRRWVGHNLNFDLRMLHRHSISLYGDYEDTSINAPLLDENSRSYSLDSVAKAMGVQTKKGDELYAYMSAVFNQPADKKIMEHFWRTDASVSVVWQYAAGDGVSTEEVVAAQRIQIAKERLEIVHDVECRLIKTLFRMTRDGVRINEERLREVDQQFERQAKEAAAKFPPGFKPASTIDMKKFLGDLIDENWPRNPPSPTELRKAAQERRAPVGALKFDADTLALVPQGRDIIDLRQMLNARSLFTQPMLTRHLRNGRVHCHFWQMASDDFGTISGRLSCTDPNLQAVSKRNEKIGKAYRSVFEPEEGHVWDDNDYKQQEYVVFTDYTDDAKLAAGYRQDPPVDIHQTVANMLGVERDPTAKRMNLGMLYGMGVAKLALSLGVPLATAKGWMEEYHRQFPSARGFLRDAERVARRRGFVFTYLRRRRRFPNPDLAHIAGNAIIQGSSADITKLKMVEVDEFFASEGDEARLMLQIHDSLSWSRPDTERGKWLSQEAIRIMKDFGPEAKIKLKIPMNVDSTSGRNWGEATYGA